MLMAEKKGDVGVDEDGKYQQPKADGGNRIPAYSLTAVYTEMNKAR
jgi:hypothetical protein